MESDQGTRAAQPHNHSRGHWPASLGEEGSGTGGLISTHPSAAITVLRPGARGLGIKARQRLGGENRRGWGGVGEERERGRCACGDVIA